MAHSVSKSVVESTAAANNHTVRQFFRVAWMAMHGSEPSDGLIRNDLRRFDRRNFIPSYVRNLVAHRDDFAAYATRH